MSAEDRLREILHAEASTLVPAGDGLAHIRERVARRRRLRLLLVPAGALITVGAVVAVIALTGTSATQRLRQDPIAPATQTSTSPAPSAAPATYAGPAIWPFTSIAQGQAWTADHGNRPWAGDSLQVATHFVSDFLKLTGVSALGSGATIDLRVQGNDVGLLQLIQLGGDTGPWTVTSVGGTDLTITTPAPLDAISSPTQVSGRVHGVDENVQLQLIGSAAAHELGATTAPAGGEVPWAGSLPWTDQTWFTAGLAAITRSNKDGAVTRITVIAVKRSH